MPNELNILDATLRNGANIIYFGDSSTTFSSKNDPSSQSIPEILARTLPKSRLWAIPHPSFDMDVYDAYSQYIINKGYHPKFLIFPINLRSFSSQWNCNPLAQFRSDKFIARFKDTIWIKFYHPLGILKYFESPTSMYTYEHIKILYNNEYFGLIKDLRNPLNSSMDKETQFKKEFILDYMYQLSPRNRILQSMLKLVQRLKNSGIEAIFYITPIDIQTGAQLIGDNFPKTLLTNTQLIKSLLADKSMNVLDISTSLPTKCFIWPEEDYVNEHLNILGRFVVAKDLAEETGLRVYK